MFGPKRHPAKLLFSFAFSGLLAASAGAGSFEFVVNAPLEHDYSQQLVLAQGFGDGEFTLELWVKPDDSFPVGPTVSGPEQLTNWCNADNEPYSSSSWWYDGNFLLDGHNNAGNIHGTFSLQFYGGGRVRWLFGDSVFAGLGGHWSVGAWPATAAASLLDGDWHQITLVRRWLDAGGAQLELWVDGGLIATETTPVRTNMRTYWDAWGGFPAGQEGWFFGAEKQAAIGILTQYEDYKGLVDELRFWSRAKSADEIANGWMNAVAGDEPGLVGRYAFEEGSGTWSCDSIASGSCMEFYRIEPSAWSAENAPVVGDSDYDGVLDGDDNCTEVTNPDQRDTNGDGYGNACDPDLDNNGVVNFIDLNALRAVMFTASGDPGYDPDADFNDDDAINFADVLIMSDYFFGPPGPSGRV